MNTLLIVSTAVSMILGISSLVKQYQMLQQNSYFPSRYLGWLKTNFSYISVFLFAVSSALLLLEKYILHLIFIAICALFSVINAVKVQKKSIKKLVFTARIKRLFAVAVIIFAALIALTLLKSNKLSLLFAEISFLLSFISPIIVLITWGLTLPIEKAFARYYINDAKKILKSHKGIKVIGITGSYGKTTTKFILTRILSEKFNVVCTPQSFNTPMGVVRTVRGDLKPQTEIFVCEMGAKNVGDIKEICDIVNPDFALITSVGPQHLDTFKSIDNVFKTKFELANAVKEKNGKVFVNADSEEIASRLGTVSALSYGTNNKSDYFISDLKSTRQGSEFTLNIGEEKIDLSTKLLGKHSAINIAGAAALAYNLGVCSSDIQFAVASLKPTEHRLEMKSSLNDSVMIDDAYNSNPEGCLEAVRVLGSFSGMQKIIITPGLIELGVKEYDCNFALGLEATKIADKIILVGKNRSKPMLDAINTTDFNKDNLFVANSFFEAMEIYSRFADNKTVLLVENDLPDNYLN